MEDLCGQLEMGVKRRDGAYIKSGLLWRWVMRLGGLDVKGRRKSEDLQLDSRPPWLACCVGSKGMPFWSWGLG